MVRYEKQGVLGRLPATLLQAARSNSRVPAEPRSKRGEKLYAGASAIGSAKLAGSMNAPLSPGRKERALGNTGFTFNHAGSGSS